MDCLASQVTMCPLIQHSCYLVIFNWNQMQSYLLFTQHACMNIHFLVFLFYHNIIFMPCMCFILDGSEKLKGNKRGGNHNLYLL